MSLPSAASVDSPKNGDSFPVVPPVQSPGYSESLVLTAVFGLIILLVYFRAFETFFYAEDFNWTALYLAAHKHLFSAAFMPHGVFFRPAAVVWIVGTQMLLPWNAEAHHVRNFLFTLVNIFLFHRILLRLTVSRYARIVGMAVFALSKIQLTTIGWINVFEAIIELFQFLLALLFLLRYQQQGKSRDYVLSIVFFACTALTRDYSVLLGVVLLSLIFIRTLALPRDPAKWRRAIGVAIPFVLVAAVYLLLRFAIVPKPQVGSNLPYSIRIDPTRMAWLTLVNFGNLLNLGVESDLWKTTGLDLVHATGNMDAVKMLTSSASAAKMYHGVLFLGALALFGTTIIAAALRRPWILFALLWAGIMLFPTLLIGNYAMYYLYESTAAFGMLLALAIDGVGFGPAGLKWVWASCLVLIGVNGYANNRDIDNLSWKFLANNSLKIYQQVIAPNRHQTVRSLIVVAPNEQQAFLIHYVLDACGEGAMLKALFGQEDISFTTSIGMTQEALAALAGKRTNLVYSQDESTQNFVRIRPLRLGACQSFENSAAYLKTAWILNSKTMLDLNREPQYVSNGVQSVRVRVTAAGGAQDHHYGGVEFPIRTDEFRFDFWIDHPEKAKAIYVGLYDKQLRLVSLWINSAPAETLRAGDRYGLVFRRGLADRGFLWRTGAKDATAPALVHVFADAKDGGELSFYLDEACEFLGEGTPSTSLGVPSPVQLYPPETLAGKAFNVQPDGHAAMGMVAVNATPDTVIVFGSEALKTVVNGPTSLSVEVPPRLYAKPGVYQVRLVSATGESYSLPFTVRAK